MKIWRGVVLSLAVLAALPACAAPAGGQGGDPSSTRLRVAAAFYPFQFVAERVGGDLVEVESLTRPGAEPHDLELTPQQVALLAAADLLVYQAGFQPAVDAALQQVPARRVVDTAAFLTLLPAAGEEEHHEGEESHDHGATDPHTWQDPTNLAAVAGHVRDALAEARPEAAARFSANAEALVADLASLDTGIKASLAGCRIDTFITSHEAFGYFAARYGLTQVGIRGLEPDVEPTAARIAEVQRIARAEGVTTIFFETLVSPVVSESIAGDLGLRTDVLDPIEGIAAESRGTDYLEVMRANATALQAANQCG